MRRSLLLKIVILIAACVVVFYFGFRWFYPPSRQVSLISFDDAVEYVLRGGVPERLNYSGYRWLQWFEGEPFVTPDGLVEGYLEWLSSEGYLYETEYPSGKISEVEIECFNDMDEKGDYYIWRIELWDGAIAWVDAQNGDLLVKFPSRVPGVLNFRAAVRVIYASQNKIDEWKVQDYKRIDTYESEPIETPDELVEGHMLWRSSNGTLYEVWPPFVRHIIRKVYYIETAADEEEYNLWEIIAEDKTYFIDARNGIIRLILEKKVFS